MTRREFQFVVIKTLLQSRLQLYFKEGYTFLFFLTKTTIYKKWELSLSRPHFLYMDWITLKIYSQRLL